MHDRSYQKLEAWKTRERIVPLAGSVLLKQVEGIRSSKQNQEVKVHLFLQLSYQKRRLL